MRKLMTSAENVAILYAEGLSIEKVAEKLDVSIQTVKNTMIENNIPRRPKGPMRNKKKQMAAVVPEPKPANGIRCTDKVMRTCVYANTNGEISCDYIGVTGHMRGCSPDDCTRYERSTEKKKRRVWHEKNWR